MKMTGTNQNAMKNVQSNANAKVNEEKEDQVYHPR